MASSATAVPEAVRAAQGARLGSLVEVFPFQARRLLAGALGLTVLLVVIGVVVLRGLRGGETSAVWVLAVVGLTALYAVWRAASALREGVANRRRNRQVCLFEGGFVVVDAGTADVWSWRDVAGVRQNIVQYRSEYGGDRGVDRSWTVLRHDGRSITFHKVDIGAADRLGEAIAAMAAQRGSATGA